MSKLVLGISGWKNSGKDMVSDYLVKEHGFVRLSFADPLKEMAAKEFSLPLNDFYDRNRKEAALIQYPVKVTDPFIKGVVDLLKDEFRALDGRKPEKIYTVQGNEFVQGEFKTGLAYDDVYWTPRALAIFKGSGNRAVDGDFWIKQAMQTVLSSSNDRFVIPDLRFITEAQSLKNKFGDDFVSVRIDRFESVDSNDPSERNLDDFAFDFKINNKKSENVSLDRVYHQVNQLMRSLFGEVSST